MSEEKRVANFGYAAYEESGVLKPYEYTTRKPAADELLLKVLYCGICHTDIHMARNEWHNTHYPCVPGHEYVGEVVEVGQDNEAEALTAAVSGGTGGPGSSASPHSDDIQVQSFEKGDVVGVGFMCDSCGACESCLDDRQMHCLQQVDTFSGFTRGEWTQGGYAKYAVVRKAFVVKVPKDMPRIEDVAPLMCAGITTYAPIVYNHMDRGGLRIGVIGLGGLGHLAVQFAHKIHPTNEVYVISRSKNKEPLAKELGAIAMIATANEDQMKEFANTFDYLLDTVAVSGKPLNIYMQLLKPLGTLITVGLPPVDEVVPMPVLELVTKNCNIQGSLVGGIRLMQEMIDFCAKNLVLPMCEHLPLDQCNVAYERILKSDVKFRFVIDVAKSLEQ